jgi:diaminopimelate epimerase
MEIPFIKVENAGNDYIYVAEKSIRGGKINVLRLARRISDRHFGIGSDGLIVVRREKPGVAFMRIYNSDGSEAELCGNGLRGVCLFLRRVFESRRRIFTIHTSWDHYSAGFIKVSGHSAVVRTSLGSPVFESSAIGYSGSEKVCVGMEMEVFGNRRALYCVAMPNPFAVIFVDNFDFDWQKEGGEIEHSPLFRNGINVMFTRIDSKGRITVRPWERGSGATLACGSGAAAAVVISSLLGYAGREVSVNMPGGTLRTSWDIEENMIFQEGPSRIVFSGSFLI